MIHLSNGQPFVRPCRSIPQDGTEEMEWSTPIASIYERVTTLLPLAGGAALVPKRIRGEARLAAALRDEAPWMGPAIDLVAEAAAMSLWAGRPWLRLQPLLLVGPPGAGKSHFARRIGELAGCGHAVLSLAGVSSNSELAGNPRGFRHPQPAFPACVMQRVGTANPVVIIDEVEKSAAGSMGDPVASLLGMLERSEAARYFDSCLAAEIDLGHVNWILTANSVARLAAPLLSRVTVVEVTGPSPEHAETVLATLWRDVARDAGLPPSALPRVEAAAETMLLRLFRRTRSVRRLRRAVEAVVAVSARHGSRALN